MKNCFKTPCIHQHHPQMADLYGFGKYGLSWRYMPARPLSKYELMKQRERKVREREKLRKQKEDDALEAKKWMSVDAEKKKVEAEKGALDLLGEGERKEGDIKGDFTKKRNYKNKREEKTRRKKMRGAGV